MGTMIVTVWPYGLDDQRDGITSTFEVSQELSPSELGVSISEMVHRAWAQGHDPASKLVVVVQFQ